MAQPVSGNVAPVNNTIAGVRQPVAGPGAVNGGMFPYSADERS